MRPPETAPRQGCPELEALAAFVEGKLEGTERAAVVAHLADCDACREVVAESRALAGELELAGRDSSPEVRSLPVSRRPGFSSGWGVGLAAVLGLAAVGLGYLALLRPQSVEAVLGGLVNRGEALSLPETWTDPAWSVMRGEAPTISERAVAFRLGARSADLTLALAMKDQGAVRRLAVESVFLLAAVPFSEPIATAFRELAAKVSEPSANWSELARSVSAANGDVRDSVDEALLDLGRWAETGRLLAASRSTTRPPGPPGSSPETAELAELVAFAESTARSTDLAAREAAFERLVARGGDLR